MNSADSHQEHTPEFYRQRYLELKARGQDTNSLHIAQALPENPRIIRPGLVISDEMIPAVGIGRAVLHGERHSGSLMTMPRQASPLYSGTRVIPASASIPPTR